MARRTIAVLIALLALVVASILWLPRARDPAAATPSAAAPDEATVPRDREAQPAEPASAAEARAAIESSATPPAAPTGAGEPEVVVFGRVVGARRMPVAGAEVGLRLSADRELAATTADDGSFAIEVAGPVEKMSTGTLLIARAPGALALRDVWLTRSANAFTFAPDAGARPRRVDLGTIALARSFPLRVRVSRDGAAVAGARVVVELDPFRRAIAERTTGADGVATFEALPGGLAHLRAFTGESEARGRAYLPDEGEIALELAPYDTYVVEVVDAATKAPIAGASIGLVESYSMAARGDPESQLGQQESGGSRDVERAPEITGADGRVRIAGIAKGAKTELRVSAAGYSPNPSDRVGPARSGVRLSDPSTVVRVELEPSRLRTVRWPIVAGEAPPPPDGSSIALSWAPGSVHLVDDAPAIEPGRVEGSTLVAELVDGRAFWIAEAPDGALATLIADKDSTEGQPVSFRRPRSIEVTVRDRGGNPVAGAGVTARSQGNNPLCDWVATDSEGRATLAGLYGGLAEVHVAPPDGKGGGTRVASVDLEQGDGRVEATIASSRTARLVLKIDGVPALPEKLRVGARILEEFPERGELRLALPESIEPVSIGVSALGFVPAVAVIPPHGDGSEPVVVLELVRATELLVRLQREPSQRVEIAVERWSEEKSTWENDISLRLFNGLRTPNGPGDSFVIAGLAAGRWRAVDRASGATSDAIDVTASVQRAVVDLYVAAEQWVSGRVEVPPGATVKGVVVLVDGASAPSDTFRTMPGEGPPRGAYPGDDGSFRVRVPGDREVTVRPWHPWLAPAPDGVVKTTLGRDGVVLRLVEGTELRIALAPPADAKPLQGVRVALYRGAPRGEPVEWIHAPVAGGVARFGGVEPGRWTLWIDPGRELAPIALEDVEVLDGVNAFEAPPLTRGASVRVRVLVPADQATPRVYVHASPIEAPAYYRSINSRGEAEVVLGGLGAGRFKVGLSAIMGDRRKTEREVDLDGRSEVALDFDLR